MRAIKTMRLVVLLLLFSVGSVLFANAQGVRLDLQVKQKSLIEVIDILKQKTGFSFVYSAADAERVTGLTFDLKNKTIREVLDAVLAKTNFVYTIDDKVIILKRKVPVRPAAKRMVRGVVVGTAPNDTLPGVTVMVKGTTTGVTTDVHGKFSIVIPDGDDVVLRFTFIGKKMAEVHYKGQEFLTVKMEDDAQELEEVVINAGYQQIDKRKLTSAVTTLKMDDIMTPGMTTLDQMLEGRVPGMVFMQNSGQVGASPRLRIRGTSTVLGSQEPLWVVDGIIQEDPVNVDPAQLNDLDFVNLLGNAISGLNPEDIQQIDVLKDASATALYGTRAANGVIVITTKQGKEGPPTVRYSFSGTLSRKPRYSDRNVNVMNSAERVAYSREILEKKMEYGDKNTWIGYEKAFEDYRNGLMTFEQFQQQTEYYETLDTDWFDVLCRDAFSHTHSLSFSGGSKTAKYYASVGYNRQNGVLQKEFGDRYTASMKVTLNYDRFNATFDLKGNVQKQEHTPSDVGLMDFAYNTSRAIPVYNEDGSLYFYPKKMVMGGDNAGEAWFNILNERDNSYENIDKNQLSFSVNANYNILENLKLTGVFAYSISNTDDDVYHGATTHYAKSLAKKMYGMDDFTDSGKNGYFDTGSFRQHTNLPYGGELRTNSTKNENYNLQSRLQYHIYLDEEQDHMLSAMAGFELTSSRYTGLSKTFRCYVPERGLQVGNVDFKEYGEYTKWLTTDANALGKFKDTESNKLRFMGVLNYSYQNRYIFNANMSVDYSNQFGDRARDKFLPIWSVSGRWNMHEDLLKNVYWVNDLALTASFGYQGTTQASQIPDLIMVKGELDPAFNEFGSTIKSFPNPDLSWEKTMSLNSTLHFSLFNHKLSGTLSYFYKKTTDAFLNKKVMQVNGVSSYSVNEGTVTNQGVEVSLNINPINTTMGGGNRNGFMWRIDPQLGGIVNKLINRALQSNAEDPLHDEYTYMDFLNGNAHVSGKPLNSFYSYEFTGLSADDGRPTFARVGEEYFAEYVDMPKADVFTKVMRYSGCRVPVLQGGISNTFSWKGFVLDFNLTYSLGSKVRLLKLFNPDAKSLAVSPIQNLRKEMVDRWQVPGDEKYTNIPGILPKKAYENTLNQVWWRGEPYAFAKNIWEMYNYADVRVISGNYLKLQRLNLRYVFSDEVCKKLRCKSMYVSLSGTNLFTWAAKELKGQDPSSQSGSADKINVAVQPTYSLSVNVSF
ncbi:SusC/RagA family TonB-linked outer membrane protein [Butyricimonas hominis]|uniref:SusC/RagA family TonB-linked outer membrane protein n=1 Tax=Butyricimonas TaxID=574697 RepID=UPI0035145B0A